MSIFQSTADDLVTSDMLLVTSHGIGLPHIWAEVVKHYATNCSKITFLVNFPCSHYEDLLIHHGLRHSAIPMSITNEILIAARRNMYIRGGCYIITSRILLHDLLRREVPSSNLAGIIIYNAHLAVGNEQISFLIRVMKRINPQSFVKAMTDNPEALRGFTTIERTIADLQVHCLRIISRYDHEVSCSLDSLTCPVVELSIRMTSHMKRIQTAILVAIESCIRELVKSLPHIALAELNVDLSITKAFDKLVRSALVPEWTTQSSKTSTSRSRSLVSDIRKLRNLLESLLRFDSISFFDYLSSIRISCSGGRSSVGNYEAPSLWLTTEAADKIFSYGAARVYSCSSLKDRHSSSTVADNQTEKMELVLKESGVITTAFEFFVELPQKWDALDHILEEIFMEQQSDHYSKESSNCDVMIIVHDNRTKIHLTAGLQIGLEEVVKSSTRSFILDYNNRTRKSLKSSKGAISSTAPILSAELMTMIEVSTDVSYAQFVSLPDFSKHMLLEEIKLNNGSSRVASDIAKGVATVSGNNVVGDSFHMILSAMACFQDDEDDKNDDVSMDECDDDKIDADELPVNRKRKIDDGNSELLWSTMINNMKDQSSAASSNASSSTAPLMSKSVVENENAVLTVSWKSKTASSDTTQNLQVSLVTASALDDDCLLFERNNPNYVIVYEPDLSLVRRIEVYQSHRKAALQSMNHRDLRVYFMCFGESIEERRYLDSIEHEKQALEELERNKTFLSTAKADHSVAAGLEITAVELNSLPRMIVDIREFRSSFPSMIDKSGKFKMIPATLLMGDYMILPSIDSLSQTAMNQFDNDEALIELLCNPSNMRHSRYKQFIDQIIVLERKSVSDLFGSLASGRLFSQVEALCKNFNFPCLLIESNLTDYVEEKTSDKPQQSSSSFNNQPAVSSSKRNVNTQDLQSASQQLAPKLCVLVAHFPKLRIIWSRTPAHSADICSSLAAFQTQRLKKLKLSVSTTSDANVAPQNFIDHSQAYLSQVMQADNEGFSEEAECMLRKLPGVTESNAFPLMAKALSLEGLTMLKEDELAEVVDSANAKKLSDFLDLNVIATVTTAGPQSKAIKPPFKKWKK